MEDYAHFFTGPLRELPRKSVQRRLGNVKLPWGPYRQQTASAAVAAFAVMMVVGQVVRVFLPFMASTFGTAIMHVGIPLAFAWWWGKIRDDGRRPHQFSLARMVRLWDPLTRLGHVSPWWRRHVDTKVDLGGWSKT